MHRCSPEITFLEEERSSMGPKKSSRNAFLNFVKFKDLFVMIVKGGTLVFKKGSYVHNSSLSKLIPQLVG